MGSSHCKGSNYQEDDCVGSRGLTKDCVFAAGFRDECYIYSAEDVASDKEERHDNAHDFVEEVDGPENDEEVS